MVLFVSVIRRIARTISLGITSLRWTDGVTVARSGNTDVIGLIAIAVGGMLVLGALMFLAATFLMSGVSRVVLIPPVIQIALGLLGSIAGFLLRQGHAMAKFALWFVAIGVVANLVFLVAIAVATMG